jgi:acyl-CoA thioester hydrolase
MNSNLTEPIHRTTCRVFYGDTDAGGVVYYANYMRFFEVGRTEFMRDWICSYRDIEKQGLILPVTECYSRFKAPAFYDDLLIVETSLTELKKLSCRFCYKISRQEDDNVKPKLLVKGFTIHASVNRDGRLTSLPEEILEKLRQYV